MLYGLLHGAYIGIGTMQNRSKDATLKHPAYEFVNYTYMQLKFISFTVT